MYQDTASTFFAGKPGSNRDMRSHVGARLARDWATADSGCIASSFIASKLTPADRHRPQDGFEQVAEDAFLAGDDVHSPSPLNA